MYNGIEPKEMLMRRQLNQLLMTMRELDIKVFNDTSKGYEVMIGRVDDD